MQVTATGERKPFGKRRHACLNHPVFCHVSVRITTCLAEALRDSPHIVGVQIDNEGRVYHVGTVLDEAATGRVTDLAITAAGLVPVATSDHNPVEVTEVSGPEGRFLDVLNFSDQERTIRLGEEATDLSNGTACGPVITLPALDGRVFRLLEEPVHALLAPAHPVRPPRGCRTFAP